MPVVGLRQLSRDTRDVVEQLERDGEPVVVTRQGRPIATLSLISERQAAAAGLALAPEFVASRERAAEAIAAGAGRPASELLAKLGAEAEPKAEEASAEEASVELVSVLSPSLLERVARAAVAGLAGSASSPPIVTLNAELTSTLMEDVIASVVERVRTVNENIVAQAGGEAIPVELYADRLHDVTEAERLLSRRRGTAAKRLATAD